jgi:UDP-N-acetyl-D-glucosamine dehydrogenase
MAELLQRLEDRTARVAVVGQGYVGLVVAMRASEAGFGVLGLEVDEERAKRLAGGESYIEDVPDEVLRAALDRGYRASADPDDLDGFDVAVISVPTPLHDGTPDLSFIESAGALVGRYLQAGALVVLESTTYPGTTEELLVPILEATSGLTAGEDFLVGYSPERIDPGNPRYGLHNTPKIVSGIDAASLAAVEALFGAFVGATVPVSGCGEAELAKVIENTFRHVNIALVNELAMFAEALGVDVNESIDAAATKPFGYMKFTPGPGVGGHCLPIDPTYLSWRIKRSLGENFRFIELANDVNEGMPRYVAARVTAALNRDRKAVNGSRIVILGLSYKANVGDAREAPSAPLIRQLLNFGAEVVAVDPYVDETCGLDLGGVELRTGFDEAFLREADLVVVVTDHDAFDYELIARASPRVLDTRARLAAAPHIERL